MTDPAKRKLSAKAVLADIRSGMDVAGLKRKYDLSDKALESVFTRLAATGLLSEHEIVGLRPRQSAAETPPAIQEKARWRCPACNAPQAREMPECPVCGVIVAKFVAREEQERHEAGTAPHAWPDTGPSGRTGWRPVITSIAVLVLVGGALLFWSAHRANEAPEIAALDTQTQSAQQAETDAEEPVEKSADAASTDTDYSEIETEDSQETLVPAEPIAAIPQETPSPTVAVPREQPPPVREDPEYVTGVLRQFSSTDFKKEVVEASKTYPVLFQFYSNT